MKFFRSENGILTSKNLGRYGGAVLAPDYVVDGWAYDPSKEGDARFIRVFTPEVQRNTREYLYESRPAISFEGMSLTVDEANKRFAEYFAEGNTEKYSVLRTLIEEAKSAIRKEYPDEVTD